MPRWANAEINPCPLASSMGMWVQAFSALVDLSEEGPALEMGRLPCWGGATTMVQLRIPQPSCNIQYN